MILVAQYFGLIGVAAITATYFLLNAGKMNPNDWPYPFFNFLGAALIVWSLTYEWNLAAFLMEVSWAIISLYGLIMALKKNKHQ